MMFKRTQKTDSRKSRYNSPRRDGRRPSRPVTRPAAKKDGQHDAEPKLRIYALGGLEEVGRNSTVFEMGDDIVIVDFGLQFPEEDMPGIDYIIPNVECLRGKEKNIRGVIITHGHYDHIGGIPHIMGRIGNPILYTAPLTAGIIRKRQEEYRQAPPLKIQIVKDGDVIQMGEHFKFEPFHINHNISDAFGVALHTPYGIVINTGDFKFDLTPVNDDPPDFEHIASFGAQGVLALLSDSTSADVPGHQISEKVVGEELYKVFEAASGRIIVGTFSSLLTRIQQMLTICEALGKKVLIQGRSMKTNIDIAHELGYLKYSPGIFIEDRELNKLPPEKVVVICTGAQGEKNAQLMRIANHEHRLIELEKGDTIIFSSSVIPGNERTIQKLKDTIVRQGARVIHYALMDVHAGGHAKQEDLKQMIELVKPKYFVPIHSNRFRLQDHADLAKSVGIAEENIFIADNGQIIEFDKTGGRLTEERVVTDYVMVDGLGVGDVSDIVLRDRLALAADGMFVVIVTIDTRTGELIGNPDIISRGFVYLKESRDLIEKARHKVKKMLKDADPNSPAFEDYLKNRIRNEVGEFLYSLTKRRPMILPVLIEV